MKFKSVSTSHPRIGTRAILLVVGIIVIGILSYLITGSIISQDNRQALIFQGGLLLVVFGSLILEDKFTKPADAVINSIAAIISLIPVYPLSNERNWQLVFVYCLIVLVAGLVNLIIATKNKVGNSRAIAIRLTYSVATTLGKANLIYSIVFLYAVFSFYGLQSEETALLIAFWGIYIVLWPLKIPHIIDSFLLRNMRSINECGLVIRVDDPDLIRVKLHPDRHWSGKFVASLGDGRKRQVLPLYTQVQDEAVIGTGLLLEDVVHKTMNIDNGMVIQLEDNEEPTSVLPVGIVGKGTQIAILHFETWQPDQFREGSLVFCYVGKDKVYYQVTDAITTEESFEHHRHGFQIVEAHQLGTYEIGEGFSKFTWLPQMNTAVYLVKGELQGSPLQLPPTKMSLGTIPGSDIEVICKVDEMISHHTAILGVTGSGKTELALNILESAVKNGVKVLCVDITSQYKVKLVNLNPAELSISEDNANDLGKKLLDVDTGEFKAANEKKILNSFESKLRTDIDSKVTTFMNGASSVGIFTMPSISNTKATLFATEIYLTSIFNYARSNLDKKRILIVLEEAHTVIPETSTMGLGDFDSKGMVAKIAQIGLQGRKYDVGLLVIAQRTATVSKTVLSQCNTIITFASYDQTGLAYLSNIYGNEHSSKISNLPFLHALVFGKGIQSERPVIVQLHRKDNSDSP